MTQETCAEAYQCVQMSHFRGQMDGMLVIMNVNHQDWSITFYLLKKKTFIITSPSKNSVMFSNGLYLCVTACLCFVQEHMILCRFADQTAVQLPTERRLIGEVFFLLLSFYWGQRSQCPEKTHVHPDTLTTIKSASHSTGQEVFRNC